MKQAHIIGSVNSTQAAVGQNQSGIWMESGFQEGRLEMKLKEMIVVLRNPDQKEKMTCQPAACLEMPLCVNFVFVHGSGTVSQSHVQTNTESLIRGYGVVHVYRAQRLPCVYQ